MRILLWLWLALVVVLPILIVFVWRRWIEQRRLRINRDEHLQRTATETSFQTSLFQHILRKWRQPLVIAISTAGVCAAIDLSGAYFEWMLYIFVVAPMVSITLLAVAALSRTKVTALRAITMLAIFWITSLVMFRSSGNVRPVVRWLFSAKSYKAELLRQPEPRNGELRHMEWDGWGGFGTGDTVEYLVFDPQDSLLAAAKRHARGKFNGLPCEVPIVRKLESRWYAVVFYTDYDWDHCN